MGFFVTRQSYWYMNRRMVEVSYPLHDYIGSDMLPPRPQYQALGEGHEYNDPREAVEAAIDILTLWRKDSHAGHNIGLTIVNTMGMGFEGEPITIRQARSLAKKMYNALPRCPQCNDLMPSDHDKWIMSLDFDTYFCSENCAENAYADSIDEDEEYYNVLT